MNIPITNKEKGELELVKHEQFIKCLEEHGSRMDVSGGGWSLMASKLNWSIEEVKHYAFWYMQQLQDSLQNEHEQQTQQVEEEEVEESESYIENENETMVSGKRSGNAVDSGVVDSGGIRCHNDDYDDKNEHSQKSDNRNEKDDKTNQNRKSESSSSSLLLSSWTYGECALFDTLIITYDAKTINRWEKIASFIPNKTHKQCRQRWEDCYSSR